MTRQKKEREARMAARCAVAEAEGYKAQRSGNRLPQPWRKRFNGVWAEAPATVAYAHGWNRGAEHDLLARGQKARAASGD